MRPASATKNPMTSAAEHAFGRGAPLTLGVEEEYMLLDASTFELASRFDEVAEVLAGGSLDGRADLFAVGVSLFELGRVLALRGDKTAAERYLESEDSPAARSIC